MNFVWYGMVCRAAVDVDSEKNIIVFIKFNMASKLYCYIGYMYGGTI